MTFHTVSTIVSQTLGWSITTLPVATPTLIKQKHNPNNMSEGESRFCRYLQACRHQPYASKNYFTLLMSTILFKNMLVHFLNYTKSLAAHTQWGKKIYNYSPSDWILVHCIDRPKGNASSIFPFSWHFDQYTNVICVIFFLTIRFHTTLAKPAYQDWEKSFVH